MYRLYRLPLVILPTRLRCERVFRKKYVAIFYCFGLVLFSDDALVFFRLVGVIVIAFTITIRYYHCYYRYIYRDFHYYFILSSSPLSS